MLFRSQSPPRDREDQRRGRDERDNGDYPHRRERPREYIPRDHVPHELSQNHDRPRVERERSPERSARDREPHHSRDRASNGSGHFEEHRARYVDPVHWEVSS